MSNVFEVIIIGAGPGGSSMATFLGRRGIPALLLDKAHFPRDKVCGDGLTPKAIYWLDVLGCIDEVLDRSDSCCTHGDIFVNGAHLLTAKFPQNTPYPGFGILLQRSVLDHILVRNAIRHGAVFRPGCRVKRLHRVDDGVVVETEAGKKPVHFKGRLVIGADGANSIASRAIGNRVMSGTTAVSLRAYYRGVEVDRSPVQVYFDQRFFPGYGWVFVDNRGQANIGIGYAFDRNFPVRGNLKSIFHDFVNSDLKERLRHAEAVGKPKGGWTSFYQPRSMVADRVMLIGDAANLADPINGGGIHMAMESAYLAARIAAEALARGDCSAVFLKKYPLLWHERNETDWRSAELLLSIAKNPNFREVYLSLIRMIAKMTEESPRFQEFCGGIFSGVVPARKCFCPSALLDAVPLDPGGWLSAIFSSSSAAQPSSLLQQTSAAMSTAMRTSGRVLKHPLAHFEWGLEILTKCLGVASCYGRRELASLATILEHGTQSRNTAGCYHC